MLAYIFALSVSLAVGGPESTNLPSNPSVLASAESSFIANLVRRHGGLNVAGSYREIAFIPEDEEPLPECQDAICTRDPAADQSMVSHPDLVVRFDLTGGAPGICDAEECDGAPCKWSYKIEVTNNSAQGADPGVPVGVTVKQGVWNTTAPGGGTAEKNNFANFSIVGSTTVSNTPSTIGAVTVASKEMACDKNATPAQTILVKLHMAEYRYNIGSTQQPNWITVPESVTYSKIELKCENCP